MVADAMRTAEPCHTEPCHNRPAIDHTRQCQCPDLARDRSRLKNTERLERDRQREAELRATRDVARFD